MARPFETYSKRNSLKADVLTYTIHRKLRNQVYHICTDFFYNNDLDEKLVDEARQNIYDIICSEEGVKSLYLNGHFIDNNPADQVDSYFENLENTDKVLDTIEVVFHFIGMISKIYSENYRNQPTIRYDFKACIADLNKRFFENGVGYQYESGKIIKVSNEILHQEVTKKALEILREQEFENANEEFLKAHEHFRHDRLKECLNESLKSFESVLKILIKKNGWQYNEKDTAKALIEIAFANRLVPTYLQNSFTGIRTILESSIPTIRNKNSGHGQGPEKIIVPKHLASYMLYLTGATIIYLVSSDTDNRS
jgi:hypothetical protein